MEDLLSSSILYGQRAFPLPRRQREKRPSHYRLPQFKKYRLRFYATHYRMPGKTRDDMLCDISGFAMPRRLRVIIYGDFGAEHELPPPRFTPPFIFAIKFLPKRRIIK